ncbi:hypothetical protein MSPP1_001423 [Malassezia sp. CBS 17886]|nr:hypothetical protein MSPP1_001423 [Malassezia sp. CBS 17886]
MMQGGQSSAALGHCVAANTGASRGIGAEIAKALAKRGANVVVAAKSSEPHKTLPGTIHSVVDEVHAIADKEQTGARAFAVQLDVRDPGAVEDAIAQAAGTFGHLDMVVNNVDAKVKTYDLVNGINARGTWLVSRFALPHLYKSAAAARNPHILMLSPPMDKGMFTERPGGALPQSFAETHALYAMSKFGMSVAAFALAAECAPAGIASNTIWPFTLIGTSAMRIVNSEAGAEQHWRKPSVVSDAAVRLLAEDAKVWTGRFLIDELYLRERHGFDNKMMAAYSLGGPDTPFDELREDLFISDEVRQAVGKYYAK